jgi:hypothetical protein
MSDLIAACSSFRRVGRAPRLQEVMPFFTSLSVHAGVVIVGLLTCQAVRVVTAPPSQGRPFFAETKILGDSPGGIQFTDGDDALIKRMRRSEAAESAAQSVLFHGRSSAAQLGDLTLTDETGGASEGGFAVGARIGCASPAGNGAIDVGAHPFGAGSAFGPQEQVFVCRGNARTIIFVCDCTGSMINKIARLKLELSQAVHGLKPNQSFNIIFYQDEKLLALNEGGMLPVNAGNVRKAETWLAEVVAAGSTDPVPALTAALGAKPQLLYFLTDAADFPDVGAVRSVFRTMNADHRTRVNTILFVESKAEEEANKESEPLMRAIAEATGGLFKWVVLDRLR